MSRRFALGITALVAVSSLPRAAHAEDDLVLDLGGTTLELRRVPKGQFMEGSAASEPLHDKDEEGPRPVTITHDFWMGKVPVTRGQFAKFVSDTRYVTEAEKSGGWGWDGKQLAQKKDFSWRNPGFAQGDDHPVVMVTYGDAIAFTAWASRKTGRRVRLPSEAEFEYAARAGANTPWPGAAKTEEDALAVGWFRPNAGNGTRPVAQRRPNAFGLFDMAGDVYEWCRDVYVPGYPRDPAIDPEVATRPDVPKPRVVDGGVIEPEPERRVLRGGSWLKDPKRGRSTARFRNVPGSRSADNGFRIVVTDDDSIAPGLGAPAPFAPATPMTLGSSSAGQLADGGTALVIEEARQPGELTWLMFAAPFASAAAVVAWMLARRKTLLPTTRIVDEGFFVRVPDAAEGYRVYYTCVVDGTEASGVVALGGSGIDETFVATRARPSAVRIREMGPAPAAPPPADILDIIPTPPKVPPPPPSTQPSSNMPAAPPSSRPSMTKSPAAPVVAPSPPRPHHEEKRLPSIMIAPGSEPKVEKATSVPRAEVVLSPSGPLPEIEDSGPQATIRSAPPSQRPLAPQTPQSVPIAPAAEPPSARAVAPSADAPKSSAPPPEPPKSSAPAEAAKPSDSPAEPPKSSAPAASAVEPAKSSAPEQADAPKSAPVAPPSSPIDAPKSSAPETQQSAAPVSRSAGPAPISSRPEPPKAEESAPASKVPPVPMSSIPQTQQSGAPPPPPSARERPMLDTSPRESLDSAPSLDALIAAKDKLHEPDAVPAKVEKVEEPIEPTSSKPAKPPVPTKPAKPVELDASDLDEDEDEEKKKAEKKKDD